MSTNEKKPYSKKHDPNLRPDPIIETEMRKRTANQTISCALAFEMAEGLSERSASRLM
ncbi:MAG: hypothetical protein PVI54_11650 [Desulfobacteraceae bacterium]|jgi:hypothetical protein